jgi:Protein of unknown function (DUF1553)/Protein of unknown function (DUF1549)/Concanavalin A-like lectin/glucanases superfamily/Planctomycete cytochrome C
MLPARLGVVLALALAVSAGSTGAEEKGPLPAPRVDFTRQIRPLLSDRCFRCHGPDGSKRKAKLRLDVREGAFKKLNAGWFVVKPGDPGKSELIRRITTDDIEDMMPPPESNLSLTDAEKALLERWIAEGADYRPHWSLAPVSASAAPALRDGSAPANPIDAFVRARLEQESLSPAPRASSEVLVRRLAFNLTGLPPSPAEIDAFLEDRAPGAYERLVDRYLGSPAYGERMAMDWLDLARYADTYGYQNDVERDVSPYRDWVISAFNRNLPYDQFLTWQLAGDLLPNATREQRIATAFNRLHRQTNEGGSIEEEFRTEYVVDRVNTFGMSMLGLTMECARCHDHRFDPITQRDYYSLFAFFNNIDESGLYSHFTNATPSPSMLLWAPGREQDHKRLTAEMRAIEAGFDRLRRQGRGPFGAQARRVAIGAPPPIARLMFDATEGDKTPDSVLPQSAELKDGVVLDSSPGAQGRHARFSGDNAIVHPGVRTFGRTDAFSLALRLQPTEQQDRAVIVHQSRAWSDAGSRGFELTLDHGRVFFGLIHFWPGNAIAVRSRLPLPLKVWSSLVVTYDGSSRAAGIAIYLNGVRLAVDVVRDHLYKDITYDRAAGDNVNEHPRLTIGARFRDSGFRNGLLDDLQVFDTSLTAAEVAVVAGSKPGGDAMFDHFLVREYQPYVSALASVRALRIEENALIAHVPELMVMEEMRQPRPAHRLERGAYDAPRELVPRDTPASLPPFPSNQPRNRLGLARWLTDRRNPLASRVAVNRIWRMHFGRGIVATQEDFGNQGRLPTHPELLDFLADRFMASGWDVKALHRLIVTSETFQQSSMVPAAVVARDPDNLLLARGPKRRLVAESIRDSALAASGLLNPTVGGPSVKPYQPAGLWEQSGTGKTYKQGTGADLYRRSLYTFWRRTLPPPSMVTFDAMSREVCTAKREVTTTPLQSLVLLNDPQFVEAARHLAETVIKQSPSAEARTRTAFRALIGRLPDDAETRILSRLFMEQQAVFAAHPDDALQLVAVGESRMSPDVQPVDLAAMTTVVSAIMNFDEFVMMK